MGLAAFMAFLVACTRSQLMAARRFEARGSPADGYLARGLFVATLATLAAGLFFSAGVDYKTWLLLALGPVLLQASGAPTPRRGAATADDRPPATARSPSRLGPRAAGSMPRAGR